MQDLISALKKDKLLGLYDYNNTFILYLLGHCKWSSLKFLYALVFWTCCIYIRQSLLIPSYVVLYNIWLLVLPSSCLMPAIPFEVLTPSGASTIISLATEKQNITNVIFIVFLPQEKHAFTISEMLIILIIFNFSLLTEGKPSNLSTCSMSSFIIQRGYREVSNVFC